MSRRLGLFSLAIILAVTGAAVPVRATPPLERKAREAGYPAQDCGYCHTFDTSHMSDKAKQMGISPMNCGACHGSKLPKSGKDLFNDRGNWLEAQKRLRQAKEIDVSWLKDYTEPKKK